MINLSSNNWFKRYSVRFYTMTTFSFLTSGDYFSLVTQTTVVYHAIFPIIMKRLSVTVGIFSIFFAFKFSREKGNWRFAKGGFPVDLISLKAFFPPTECFSINVYRSQMMKQNEEIYEIPFPVSLLICFRFSASLQPDLVSEGSGGISTARISSYFSLLDIDFVPLRAHLLSWKWRKILLRDTQDEMNRKKVKETENNFPPQVFRSFRGFFLFQFLLLNNSYHS